MQSNPFSALLLALLSLQNLAAEPAHHWPLDSAESSNFTLRGSAAAGAGIELPYIIGRINARNAHKINERKKSPQWTCRRP